MMKSDEGRGARNKESKTPELQEHDIIIQVANKSYPLNPKYKSHLANSKSKSFVASKSIPENKSIAPKSIPVADAKSPYKKVKSSDVIEHKYAILKSVIVKNSENTASGTVSPAASYEAVRPTGYEAVKPTTAKEEKDVESPNPPSSSIKGPNLWMIFAIAAAVCVFLALVVGAVIVSTRRGLGETLPNLNDTCRKDHTEDGDAKCYYYSKKYTDSCRKVNCTNVLIHSHSRSLNDWKMLFYPTNETKLAFGDSLDTTAPVEDHTPCGEGKWCINGNCEPTDDERIKIYDKEKVIDQDGEFELHCHIEDSCIENKSTVVKMKDCVEQDCTFKSENNVYRLAFRSCTKRYQLNGGKPCLSNFVHSEETYKAIPIVVVKCSYCDENINDVSPNCDSWNSADGHPCALQTKNGKYKGLCKTGLCIPLSLQPSWTCSVSTNLFSYTVLCFNCCVALMFYLL